MTIISLIIQYNIKKAVKMMFLVLVIWQQWKRLHFTATELILKWKNNKGKTQHTLVV